MPRDGREEEELRRRNRSLTDDEWQEIDDEIQGFMGRKSPEEKRAEAELMRKPSPRIDGLTLLDNPEDTSKSIIEAKQRGELNDDGR